MGRERESVAIAQYCWKLLHPLQIFSQDSLATIRAGVVSLHTRVFPGEPAVLCGIHLFQCTHRILYRAFFGTDTREIAAFIFHNLSEDQAL